TSMLVLTTRDVVDAGTPYRARSPSESSCGPSTADVPVTPVRAAGEARTIPVVGLLVVGFGGR
ncbi:MAG TPA: hypothetical protein VF576_04150, partial [Rubricoccaceae bacterium]